MGLKATEREEDEFPKLPVNVALKGTGLTKVRRAEDASEHPKEAAGWRSTEKTGDKPATKPHIASVDLLPLSFQVNIPSAGHFVPPLGPPTMATPCLKANKRGRRERS